jgi:hypothetical protein
MTRALADERSDRALEIEASATLAMSGKPRAKSPRRTAPAISIGRSPSRSPRCAIAARCDARP